MPGTSTLERSGAHLIPHPRRATANPRSSRRLYAEPDDISGEFAILVRSGLHGHGLGTALMHRIIELARDRGLCSLVGSVLRDNTRMLRLVRELGFVAENARGDEVTMVLRLEGR